MHTQKINDWNHEYPRPAFQRDSFYSLNGEWLLNGLPIIVPFPPQSKLSQYQGKIPDTLHYQKNFQLPQHFISEHHNVYLHFGAVDQIARVYLNGHDLGQHVGGYLPFSFCITDFLEDDNELIVDVIDDLSHDFPYGKQRKKRGGMWYTPVSGIWQTVWLEAVPLDPIESIQITPTLSRIHLHVETKSPSFQVTIDLEDHLFQQTYFTKDIDIDLSKETSHLHLWTPENPYLYSLMIQTKTDTIHSYFALRTISIKNQTIYLNHQPIYLHGVLDQGYFHDGLYLPKTPQEYENDIIKMKELGFNTLRKHIKIEPPTFYYACDRLGILVIQDMVNNGSYNWLLDTALPNIGLQYRPDYLFINNKQKTIFIQHMLHTLDHLYHYPCIIAYTIFNEGWGQFHADKLYQLCRHKDPTRFYDATSGWFHQKQSDVNSQHVYFQNKILKSQHQPLLLSECGGYTRTIAGHLYKEDQHYGYGKTETEEQLTDKIEQLYEEMVLPSLPFGLCGSIYTQLSDIEDEINGLYTYDRQVCKVKKQQLQEISENIMKTFASLHQKDSV